MPYPAGVERWRSLVRELTPDDLRGDPGFERIVLATVMAESGGNPAAVGDQGHSVGLAQLHDQGMGSGLTRQQRSDPRVNLGRAVPALAAAYRRTRGDPALTYKQAINPGAAMDGPQVTGVMSAYRQGGGAPPRVMAEVAPDAGGGTVDPQDNRLAGATERATGVRPPQQSPTQRRVASQTADARTRLAEAQKRLAAASTPPPEPAEPRGPIEQEAADKAEARRVAEARDARREVAGIQKEIADLEKQATDDAEKQAKPPAGSRKPTTTTPSRSAPQILVTQPDGTQSWEDNPNYDPTSTTPKATRTWTDASGVAHTEVAPDASGFSPLGAGDVRDPNAMTDYQAGELGLRGQELPIQQQNADSSSLSAAAAMLHAQVAKGTMDFDTAKQVFDYVVSQQPPVEEGGKLWSAGGNPSDPMISKHHLTPVPWRGIDAPGFFGRPELNQYVHGADPFGTGGLTADAYRQHQAAIGMGPPPAGPPPPPAPAPAPVMASSSAGTMMAADQGGFAPQPAAPPPQQAPAVPAFGGATQPTGPAPSSDGDQQKIVAMLVQKGYPLDVAQAAAQQHLGMGGMPAQY